jgi:hypothetical protein
VSFVHGTLLFSALAYDRQNPLRLFNNLMDNLSGGFDLVDQAHALGCL